MAGQPHGMALDPAAGRMVIPDWAPGSLSVHDARTGEQPAEVRVRRRPIGLALAGDSGAPRERSQLPVAETSADRLLILDGQTARRRGKIEVGPAPYAVTAGETKGKAASPEGR